MTITLEFVATEKEVANAASVLNNICNGRRSMRQNDKAAGRVATGYEEEAFEGLSLATRIMNQANKEFHK